MRRCRVRDGNGNADVAVLTRRAGHQRHRVLRFGLSFDPAQPPKTQAEAGGACAHAYRQRTSVSGRPAAWPGVVSVSWVISWQANTGETGSLPSVTRSTALPRSVQEVQTVIVGGSTP